MYLTRCTNLYLLRESYLNHFVMYFTHDNLTRYLSLKASGNCWPLLARPWQGGFHLEGQVANALKINLLFNWNFSSFHKMLICLWGIKCYISL